MAIPTCDELIGVTVSKRIVEDVEIRPEWFQAI
jgi:hypothetical protein